MNIRHLLQTQKAIGNKDVKQANYDAVASKQRRRQNPVKLANEDTILKPKDRDKLVSEARILRRNASIVSWAIRKHINYVATFSFQAKTGVPELDDQVEALHAKWSLPENFDVAGRHSLQAAIQLLEGQTITDGDAFLLKLETGHTQLLEGDRVRTPTDFGAIKAKPEDFTHGIQCDKYGKAISYALCNRDGEKFVLSSLALAEDVEHHGYFERSDQVRGISPLASAIHTFCDLYEATEYALAKMKLSQLFALKLNLSGEAEGESSEAINLAEGPQTLQLGEGEDADFLESATPSNEFQSFMDCGIAIGLKALDIPMSFYDESHTNYSGSRIALLAYEQSAETKRAKLRHLLTRLTRWRLQMFVDAGELQLPAGMTVDGIKFEYVSSAVPWIDPQKEAQANQILLDQKLASRQGLAKERGQDWFDLVDQQADEEIYTAQRKAYVEAKLKEQGLTVSDAGGTGLDLKATIDAYGAAVRSGAITAQKTDEDHFRGLLGLPVIGNEASAAWADDGGVRRPITLAMQEDKANGGKDEPVKAAA